MIVALTANASGEDRARYLACGMDAFLTKPIDEAALHLQLARAIERQLQRGFVLPLMEDGAVAAPSPAPAAPTPAAPTPAAPTPAAPTPAAPTPAAPTPAALDALFGVQALPASPAVRADNLGLRLRAAFTNDLPRRRAELDAALASDDFEAAGRILHGLRGSATYLAEPALETLCAELEAAADGRDAQRLRAGLPVLAGFLDAFETGAPS